MSHVFQFYLYNILATKLESIPLVSKDLLRVRAKDVAGMLFFLQAGQWHSGLPAYTGTSINTCIQLVTSIIPGSMCSIWYPQLQRIALAYWIYKKAKV